jgi:probable F420-dependent oxidoreductase
MELGTFGVWTSLRSIGEDDAGRAASLAEELGYGTFWLGGSPRLPMLRPLLAATERIVVATGIVNVWAYEAAELAADFAALEAEFPGRVLVGIGIGHPEATSDYRRPLTAMKAYLDVLDSATPDLPRDRRILAALAPRMLELSRDRSLGAAPYFVPVAHTAWARQALGAGLLLAPELAVVVDGDAERAQVAARDYARMYLGLANYTGNLLRHGFDDSDVADGGSDRLLREVVPQGSAAEVAVKIREHLAAGADHVTIQAVGEAGVPERGWTALAAELIG